MPKVSKKQLQFVLTQGERDIGFSLPGTKVQMVRIIWDRLVERRELGVDQEVMVAGVWPIDASWRDAHVFQSKVNCRVLGHRVAIEAINAGTRSAAVLPHNRE